MSRQSRSVGVLVLALLLGVSSSGRAEAPAAAAGRPTPVLFVPLTVDRSFARLQKTLHDLLSARMMATGSFVEAVSGQTEGAVQQCVKGANSEVNAETCWVRLGQGQGAEAMVSGEVTGTAESCTLTARLVVLETRLAIRKATRLVEPCTNKALVAEVEQAALLLAGQTPPAAPSQAQPPPTLPPPVPVMSDLAQWEILNGRWWAQEGAIYGSGGAQGGHLILRHVPMTDFSIEYTVEHVSGPRFAVSGGFRATIIPGGEKRFRDSTSDIQCNAFNFTLAGTFMPFVGEGGAWYRAHADWTDWKTIEALKKDRVRVRFEAQGTTSRFFVDGQLVDSFDDAHNPAGSAVLYVQDPTQVTRFYDFQLTVK